MQRAALAKPATSATSASGIWQKFLAGKPADHCAHVCGIATSLASAIAAIALAFAFALAAFATSSASATAAAFPIPAAPGAELGLGTRR